MQLGRRLTFACTLAVALSGAGVAHAQPPEESEDDRPWSAGTIVPSFGLGGSFSAGSGSLYNGALAFGGGVSYFVANGFGIGASFSNDFRFFSAQAKSDFPGIEDELPTYSGRLRPDITYVFFRSARFSPYLNAGVGPVFLNNGGGVLGEWAVGVGALIGLGGRAAIDLGLGASQVFPAGKCAEAWSFTASTGDSVDGSANCGLYFFPRIGLVFSLGGKRARGSARAPAGPPPATPAPPPASPPPPRPEPSSSAGFEAPTPTPDGASPQPSAAEPPAGYPEGSTAADPASPSSTGTEASPPPVETTPTDDAPAAAPTPTPAPAPASSTPPATEAPSAEAASPAGVPEPER